MVHKFDAKKAEMLDIMGEKIRKGKIDNYRLEEDGNGFWSAGRGTINCK